LPNQCSKNSAEDEEGEGAVNLPVETGWEGHRLSSPASHHWTNNWNM